MISLSLFYASVENQTQIDSHCDTLVDIFMRKREFVQIKKNSLTVHEALTNN